MNPALPLPSPDPTQKGNLRMRFQKMWIKLLFPVHLVDAGLCYASFVITVTVRGTVTHRGWKRWWTQILKHSAHPCDTGRKNCRLCWLPCQSSEAVFSMTTLPHTPTGTTSHSCKMGMIWVIFKYASTGISMTYLPAITKKKRKKCMPGKSSQNSALHNSPKQTC